MEQSTNDYHISFFKPTTKQALANRNMVVWLVLIWFIAIFGFQFLLKVLEKPTPQPAYTVYTESWQEIQDGTAGEADLQAFGKAVLSVLGKINIAPAEKEMLDNALSWSVYQLAPDAQRPVIQQKISEFESLRASIKSISDPGYVDAKNALSNTISPLLALSRNDIRATILPFGLQSQGMETLGGDTRQNLPGIMEKYLVHNQSFLTDFKFLGFPFHYFYTAIFLLILFVGLCWLYCVRTDRLNAKLNIID
jgi:putative solute:sodium symporter small subunit